MRAALKAILEDPLLHGTPLRSKKALNEVRKVLHSIQEHRSEFGICAISVMGALEKALVAQLLVKKELLLLVVLVVHQLFSVKSCG